MRNVIRADLRRILRKPVIYIWLGAVIIIFFLLSGYEDYTAETLQSEQTSLKMMAPFLTSIPVFLSVYGDEMKCGAMQCIIGRGISRAKVILSKYIECILLALIFFSVIELVMFIRNIMFNVGTTPTQNLNLFLFILILFIKTAGYFAFASTFVFVSWSTAPGMVALMAFAALVSPILSVIQELLHYNVYDLYYDGLLDKAYAQIIAGRPAVTLLPAILIFIGGSLWLTITIFKKKEIEF